jgi:hypothetical protein
VLLKHEDPPMPTPGLKILPQTLGRNEDVATRPPSWEEVRESARAAWRELFDWVLEVATSAEPMTFRDFEGHLRDRLWAVARLLVVLFMCGREQRLQGSLSSVTVIAGRRYRIRPAQARNLLTQFGVVRYWRTYLRCLTKKQTAGRRGLHPLDVALGLASDRLSMGVVSLAAYLATKLSFTQTREVLQRTVGESPSTEVLERAALGLGAHADAYFEQAPAPKDDGEVLVLQIDGKGIPTATDAELALRRRKRPPGGRTKAPSPRHRARARRSGWNRKRRHPGAAKDPRKNARVVHVVVAYTLRRGDDGLLHGPLNKQCWTTFAGKRAAFELAHRIARKRGFDPETDAKLIHIVTDGDEDFARHAGQLFRHAVHTIDLMHVLEYVWTAGRQVYDDESSLRAWAEQQRRRLLGGKTMDVVTALERLRARRGLSRAARATIAKSHNYILSRHDQLDYAWLREQDLDLASGAVEGAVNHIVALRFDHGGMRWIPERAGPLIQLRCIAFNGDWDRFIDYVHDRVLSSGRRGNLMPLLAKTSNSPAKCQKAA